MVRRSIDYFGYDPNKNAPVAEMKLKKRADHSNFSQCTQCYHFELLTKKAVEDGASRETFDEIRVKIMLHVNNLHAERAVVKEFRDEALRRKDSCFEVDDKFGSHYQCLPMFINKRDAKDAAGNFIYRYVYRQS